MFSKIFVSPQVKRIVIISNKHGIQRVAFAERLKAQDLRKLGKIKKITKLHRIIAWCSVLLTKLKFVDTSKKLLKNRN